MRAVVAGAGATLAAAEPRINDLNVYPVPDGDTGTNLALSLRSMREALDELRPAAPDALARAASRAALMGARGNSGIILSQIVRGVCDRLGGERHLDAAALAAALRGGADSAYRAVRQPVEGTMLTVVREMAEEAEACAAETLDGALDRVLVRGRAAVARTPELLATLRDAGVVDAGGAGLVEILRGAIAGLRGEDAATIAPALADGDAGGESRPGHGEESRYRYCTNFLVLGEQLDRDRLEQELTPLGDSLIVVGDRQTVKVHLHTDEPGRALSVATAAGVLDGVDIANMHAQIEDRNERVAGAGGPPALRLVEEERRACDVVCVLAGEGNARIAESFGVRRVVPGGQTMNPSTADILTAIEGAAADSVVVLPNNGNVVLAAQAAAAAATRPAVVVETRSIPAGLAALLAFDPDRPAEENAREMAAAAAAVRTAEVTRAVRDVTLEGVAVLAGSFVGLVEGAFVAADPSPGLVVAAVGERLLADGAALVTALTGEGDTDPLVDALAALVRERPGVDLEVHAGGQPHYPLLLSAE